MRATKLTGVLLLLAGLVLAADQPRVQPGAGPTTNAQADKAAGAQSAARTPSAERAVADAVLRLAPADAWLVGYSADVGKTAKHPLLSETALPRSNIPAFLQAVSRTFDGPAMLAVSGMPTDPLSWGMTFAGHTSLGRDAFFERLATEFVPSCNRLPIAERIGQLRFVDGGEIGQLTLVGPVPVSLTLGVRDGLVFGSFGPGIAEAWLESGDAGEAFIDGAEFERLIAGLNGSVDMLIYLNVRSLVPLVATKLTQGMATLPAALQLESLETLAIIAPSASPAPELRLAIGVREIDAGLWHFIAPTPSDVSLAKFFPSDTTFLVDGSMERASSFLEDLFAFAAVIDQGIADEYEIERADFKREVGFDPHIDLLGNFVAEWALGGRIERDGIRDGLLAVCIEDVRAFKRHLRALRTVYQLEITSNDYRGVTVHHALRKAGAFFYAIVHDCQPATGGVLLVSLERATVSRAIDAFLDDQGLNHDELFKAVRSRVASETSKFVYLNLGEILASERGPDELAEVPPELRALVSSPSAIALAVVPYERMIALDLASKADTDHVVTGIVFRMVMESLKQGRAQAARAVSMASVKGLLVSCMIYANGHKKQWPTSLMTLVEDGSVTRKMLCNPYKPDQTADQVYYLYRYIADPSAVKEPAAEVVISEPEIHDGGAVFGFLDGHAEWIVSPRAEELLAIMRGGK